MAHDALASAQSALADAERRTARGGNDSIEKPQPGAHDDEADAWQSCGILPSDMPMRVALELGRALSLVPARAREARSALRSRSRCFLRHVEIGRVTAHWTAKEVAREQRLKDKAKTIHPDYIARSSFAEVAIALDVNATIACSEARKFA